MLNLRRSVEPRRIPGDVSTAVALEWLRHNAPDLRIQHVRMPDGTRACGARFTFRGLTIEAKAVESPETPDPDEAIVRRCAWLMHQAMGTRLPLPGHDRESLEKQIVELASAGQAEQADALGRQLALRNEGVAIGPVRTHFEAWSGSMFQGAKER